MPYIPDASFDLMLNDIQDNAEEIHICNAEPTSYAEVATYTIGNKASPTISEPQDRTGGGREIVIAAISDGTVTLEDIPTHWALVKSTATTRLLTTGEITGGQTVYVGNPWTLPATSIGTPDAVSDT